MNRFEKFLIIILILVLVPMLAGVVALRNNYATSPAKTDLNQPPSPVPPSIATRRADPTNGGKKKVMLPGDVDESEESKATPRNDTDLPVEPLKTGKKKPAKSITPGKIADPTENSTATPTDKGTVTERKEPSGETPDTTKTVPENKTKTNSRINVKDLAKTEDFLDFSFKNTDIQFVVKYFADQINKNFIIPKTLIGTVSILVGKPIPKSKAFEVLEIILDNQGYSMFEDQHFIRIEKHGTPSHKGTSTPIHFIKGDAAKLEERDNTITAIVVLQYIGTQEMMQVLNSVRSTSALITPFPKINALFMRGSQRHLDYLLSIINKLDQPGTSGKITMVKLLYSVATEMSGTLNMVVSAGINAITDVGAPPVPGGRATRGRSATGITIIPDKRTNNLIIIATEKETEAILELIAKLDVQQPISDVPIHTFQCNNQKAVDLAGLLEKFVNQRPTIKQPANAPPIPGMMNQSDIFFIADEATNSLIVQAPPQEWIFYKDLLMKLDQPQRQVAIEVWIVEVSTNKDQTLGVEIMPSDMAPKERAGPMQNEIFPISRHQSNSLSGIFGGSTSGVEGGTTGSSVGTGATIGIRALTGTEINIDGRKIRIPNFDVFVRAVKGKSDIKLLASPKLVTLNNKKATVIITDEISIRTSEITNVETTGNVSTATYNRKEVGITLDIEPQINADDFVIMDLKLEVSNVVGELTTDPTIAKRSTENSVRCENKQTIVISGLRRNIKNKSKTGIPLLSDIPVLGALFRTKTTSEISTNLLIFITPHIVTETSDMLALTEHFKDQRLSDEEGRFDITGRRSKKKNEKQANVFWEK